MKSLISSLIGLVLSISVGAEPLIEGRVRLDSGELVADAQVRIFDMTDLRRGAVARATTDETGYFALPLAALTRSVLPTSFTLGQNYPNPFNPSTIIPYQQATSSAVRLEVFNLLGQHLATLVDEERPAGFHTATWHATDAAGRAVGAGVYIYRMTVGVESQTGRMVLIDGQAGAAAAGAASVLSGVSGGGFDGAESQVYGLIVSGSGLAPYMDPAFQVEAGMAPVELVVSSGPHSAGKVADDDCPLCDFFDAINKQQPVTIPDANLRAAIAAALGKASGATITEAEMETLTELDAEQSGIGTLTGLEYATNLEVLFIGDNPISDITPLAGLTNLRRLYIGVSFGQGRITDFTPLANLTRLEELGAIGHETISDITPLAGLTNLWNLSLGSSLLSDISPLAGMTKMRHLLIIYSNISDISPLAGMTDMMYLELGANNISDISPLAGMTDLVELNLSANNISDISPLAGMTQPYYVYLDHNNISDLAPLAAITQWRSGAEVGLRENPLNASSINTHIPALQARGVAVSFDEFFITVDEGPQIYNDNLFVLPVKDLLATDYLVDSEVRFYEHFDDAFDFLMIVSNLAPDEPEFSGGLHHLVRNDIEGIGLSTFVRANWRSADKLQSVLEFTSFFHIPTMLHEVMHRWANFIAPDYAHWQFSSANGILGGFDIANLVDHGRGRYSAGEIVPAGYYFPTKPFSPIELYLAGLIPPEEVPDLWVAEDGKYLFNETGGIVLTDNGFQMFTASQVRIYTIEDIIAEHGPRIPNASQAQRDFRAAAILLIDENHPVYSGELEYVSGYVAWFSYAGYDQYDQAYNFYEATGGRATITMDGLSQFQSRARAKKLVPISFATPHRQGSAATLPSIDSWDDHLRGHLGKRRAIGGRDFDLIRPPDGTLAPPTSAEPFCSCHFQRKPIYGVDQQGRIVRTLQR